MSSFKKNISVKCYHCSSSLSIGRTKCNFCNLYSFNALPKNKNNNIKDIYVINLQEDSHRLVSFFANIKRNKISVKNRNWHKFKAVNGKNYEEIKKEIINNNIENIEEEIQNYWNKKPGSIGCYFSHIKLWNNILNNPNSGEYSLILEDDSIITPNGLTNLEIILLKARNIDWDMMYAGHNLLKGRQINPLLLKPFKSKPGEKDIGYNSGLFGYVIKRSSIPKLLKIVTLFESPFIDVQIRNSFGDDNDHIKALFIIKNLVNHTTHNGSSRKKIDIGSKKI